jgi:hypothetical protein
VKRLLIVTAAKVLAAAGLVLSAPLALAHGQSGVSWSVSIGSVYSAPVYGPPPVVYVEPQPVYVQPQPVYVRPQPVYVQSGPVVYYGQPYYPNEIRIRRFGDHHHWRHHHYRD